MSINQRIMDALSDFGYPVSPTVYEGEAEQYFVFNYSTMGADFGDDAPQQEKYLVQVHFFCSPSFNSVGRAKQIKRKLFAAGFTWPEMTNASDRDGQHLVFECEAAEGVDPDGET